MAQPPAGPHPPDIRELCRQAVDLFASLPALPPGERAARLREVRRVMERLDARVSEAELGMEGFAREQGELVTAASALQALEIDHGGPQLPRYVEHAVAALRELSERSPGQP